MLISALPKPSEAQKAEAEAKYQRLPGCIKAVAPLPDTWIVWSTS